MTTFDQYTLSFAFPEISDQLRLLVDRHVRNVLSSYVLPANRDELVAELGSMHEFWKLSSSLQKDLLGKAHSLTHSKIETFLRKVASVAAGLNNDSEPKLTVNFEQRPGAPNDTQLYVFSAGLVDVPLCPAANFPDKFPASWLGEIDFLALMNASESFSIRFTANYPFALKLVAGNLDPVTQGPPLPVLQKEPPNYVVVSGESTASGTKQRSFVLPLDASCARNEQFFAGQKIGVIEFQIWPLCVESYFREEVAHSIPPTLREFFAWFVYWPSIKAKWAEIDQRDQASRGDPLTDESDAIVLNTKYEDELDWRYIRELGDLRDVADWDQARRKRSGVHVCNPSVWQRITGTSPPQPRLASHAARRMPKNAFIMRDPSFL